MLLDNATALLIFAHRAEAQAFESKKLGPILITGEGLWESLLQVSAYLAKNQNQVLEVWNFGVCASLDDSLNVGDVVEVRSVYAQSGIEKTPLNFHSFSAQAPLANDEVQLKRVDCLSSLERVQDSFIAKQFSAHASILDRELWAIAKACHLFKIPWRSIKLISDHPLKEKANCQWIKDQAPQWSQRLCQHYLDLKKAPKSNSSSNASHLFLDDILNNSYFHFSFSQQKQLEKLLILCQNEEQIKVEIETLTKLKILPKERSKNLIKFLEQLTNPWMAKWEEKWQEKTSHLKNKGISIHWSEQGQKPLIDLKFTSQNAKNYQDVITELQNLKADQIFDLLEGKEL